MITVEGAIIRKRVQCEVSKVPGQCVNRMTSNNIGDGLHSICLQLFNKLLITDLKITHNIYERLLSYYSDGVLKCLHKPNKM